MAGEQGYWTNPVPVFNQEVGEVVGMKWTISFVAVNTLKYPEVLFKVQRIYS